MGEKRQIKRTSQSTMRLVLMSDTHSLHREIRVPDGDLDKNPLVLRIRKEEKGK
jgi:hypothetical protein